MPPDLPATWRPAVLPDHDIEDEGTYRGLEFVDLDLAGREAASVEFDGCRFQGTDLGGAVLEKAAFAHCVVTGCNLANVRASSSSLRRAEISTSRMTGFQWVDGLVRDVTFEGCRLDLSTFRFSKFTDVVFTGCKLTGIDFTNADLGGARFVDCDLGGAQFNHANLDGTRFTRCELVDIGGAVDMRGAVLEGHNLVALAHTLAVALGITIEAAGDAPGA